MRGMIVALVLAAAPAGCWEDNSGAGKEQAATKVLQDAAAQTVGLPAIVNFTEKRMMKMLYELRDAPNLVTYSYYLDINGGKHKVCPTTSVGYGIPFAAQFTAPKAPRVTYPLWPSGQASGTGHTYEADQPEPNGLYMPSSSDATWIMCLKPDGKGIAPVYVEPKIMVSPFPLE